MSGIFKNSDEAGKVVQILRHDHPQSLEDWGTAHYQHKAAGTLRVDQKLLFFSSQQLAVSMTKTDGDEQSEGLFLHRFSEEACLLFLCLFSSLW